MLDLAAGGHADGGIARLLGVPRRDVRAGFARLRERTGARSRAQLVARWVQGDGVARLIASLWADASAADGPPTDPAAADVPR
jgi:hypothetical protein